MADEKAEANTHRRLRLKPGAVSSLNDFHQALVRILSVSAYPPMYLSLDLGKTEAVCGRKPAIAASPLSKKRLR